MSPFEDRRSKLKRAVSYTSCDGALGRSEVDFRQRTVKKIVTVNGHQEDISASRTRCVAHTSGNLSLPLALMRA